MRKIFSSKTHWFVALLLAATLVFGFSSCSSDSDDDDDSTSSSSSNSSAPSASDLAGIKLSDINASSLSALETAGQTLDDDKPEGAWIVAFNSSGTSGYGYDYEEAVSFRKELIESLKGYSGKEDIDIFQIGAMIAVHTGPYPLGIGLIRKYDR